MPNDKAEGQTILPPARSFSTFLQECESGYLHQECSEQLRELIAELSNRIQDGAKAAKGKLVLSFDFSVADGVVEVRPKLEIKMPNQPRPRSIFWATPENNLTPQNPKQQNLPFRDVSGNSAVRTL